MAIYLYKFRNVRADHSSSHVADTSTPKGPEYVFHYEGTTAPTQAQAKAVLDAFYDSIGYINSRTDISIAMSLGHADSASRTNPATGAASFRVGKALYQYAVAYHSSSVTGALSANTTWKNLS